MGCERDRRVDRGVVPGSAEGPVSLTGFDSAGAAMQQQLEKQFMDAVRRQDLKGWLERLAAKPHHVGSPYDKENAEFIAALFKSWGYETRDRGVRRALPDAEDARCSS